MKYYFVAFYVDGETHCGMGNGFVEIPKNEYFSTHTIEKKLLEDGLFKYATVIFFQRITKAEYLANMSE